VPTVLKSGSLNLLEPTGPVQVCNGIALPFSSKRWNDEQVIKLLEEKSLNATTHTHTQTGNTLGGENLVTFSSVLFTMQQYISARLVYTGELGFM